MSSIFRVQYKRYITLSGFAKQVGAFVELRERVSGMWVASLSRYAYTGYLSHYTLGYARIIYGSGATPLTACQKLANALTGNTFTVQRPFLPDIAVDHQSVSVELSVSEINELEQIVVRS